MASAFRFYLAFCQMRNFAPFPAAYETLALRSSVFNDTATFGNYISHMQKCCFLLHFPTDWITPMARHIAKGLEKRLNRRFRFSNFIRSPLLLKLAERESPTIELAQRDWISFLFAPQVRSETPQLRRAYKNDEILQSPRQPERLRSA